MCGCFRWTAAASARPAMPPPAIAILILGLGGPIVRILYEGLKRRLRRERVEEDVEVYFSSPRTYSSCRASPLAYRVRMMTCFRCSNQTQWLSMQRHALSSVAVGIIDARCSVWSGEPVELTALRPTARVGPEHSCCLNMYKVHCL